MRDAFSCLSLRFVRCVVYIANMEKMSDKPPENRPVLIEVPKPVSQMTQEEKDAFVDEILNAIDGERN